MAPGPAAPNAAYPAHVILLEMSHKFMIATLLAVASALALPPNQLTLGNDDKDFVAFAAEIDLAAARFGQIARQRAVSDEVRQFGQMVNEEHTENLKRLTSIAAKTGAAVPDSLDAKRMKTFKILKRAKVKSFDHQYLKSVVNVHEEALESFKLEAEHSPNQEIAAYAKDTLPKLEQHLKQAKELAASSK
jgi:putative membrane protein